MATKRKKTEVDAQAYNKLIQESKVLWDVLEELKKEFDFPVDSLLEIGAGTGNYLTKYLVQNERSKKIGKFYAMEPVDEFFEEAKRSVVRLSRTDATAHEYFGGNPFDVVTFSFVFNHIKPDKKQKFVKNIYNNLSDDNAKLVVVDMFVPNFSNEEERKDSIEKFLQAHLQYAKLVGNKSMQKYYSDVLKDEMDDVIGGIYKTSLEHFVKLLKEVGFEDIKTKLYKGKEKVDWESMGHYVITATKNW